MLQEPVGLRLLEPGPGLGLQRPAAFPRHLLRLPGVLWPGGSPQGLGRCLLRGRGGEVAVARGPPYRSPPRPHPRCPFGGIIAQKALRLQPSWFLRNSLPFPWTPRAFSPIA